LFVNKFICFAKIKRGETTIALGQFLLDDIRLDGR